MSQELKRPYLIELAILGLVGIITPYLMRAIYSVFGLPENTPLPARVLLLAFLVLFFLRRRKESLKVVGIKKVTKPLIFIGVTIGTLAAVILIPSLVNGILAQLITAPPTDYSFFDYIQSNVPALILWIILSWVIGGFSEELIFRGYLTNRLKALLGPGKMNIVLTVLLQAIIFGLFHTYQGIGGMISTGIVGLVLGIIYVNHRNLWPLIIAHGLLDTLGFITIYLNGTSGL